MKKILSILTVVIGSILIILGILKLTIDLDRISLTLGNSYINIPLFTNLFFVLIVNFLGGFAYIFHAIGTFNYNKELLETKIESNLVDDTPSQNDLKEMTRPIMISGSYTIIIGLWFIFTTIMLGYIGFKFGIAAYYELFFLAILSTLATGLVPIMLVGRNISLSNRIRKRKDQEKLKRFHAHMKNRQSVTRRR